ncbi:MAG: nucleotidyltransferase [Prevotellaceae bacterium]|jgi:dTDP-glucose pyrophosphorylase|nr:nucleotidyltransferase [Prevotellaceae bacterium]
MQPTLIVLAAGKGSRYGGLKQFDGVGPNGETIMDYSVYDAARSGFGKVVFIVRSQFQLAFTETFAQRYGDAIEVAFVTQESEKELPEGFCIPPERTKPWGTAHAVLMAEPKTDTPFAVINADDFYGRKAYEVMVDFLQHSFLSHGRYAMAGYKVCNTLSDSGGVSRGICSVYNQQLLTEITERHNVRFAESGKIVYGTNPDNPIQVPPDTIVSMNFWGFTPDFFTQTRSAFHSFIREQGELPTSEFYIPSVVNRLIQSQQASVQVLSGSPLWFGVTYQEDRALAAEQIKRLIARGQYPHSFIRT